MIHKIKGVFPMKIYNERLRELRIDNDLTQKAVAEKIGIRCNVYQRYEYGESKMTVEILEKICNIYGVSADYILGLPRGLKWPR